MKKNQLFTSIKVTLFFYFLVFLTQLVLFFLFPPFHVASPDQENIPFFIKLSFATHFGTVLLLYLLWGLLLGIVNSLVVRIFFNTKTEPFPYFSLVGSQFLFSLLLIFIFYPASLTSLPGLEYLPLGLTYFILMLGMLVIFWKGIKRWQVPIGKKIISFGLSWLILAGAVISLMLPTSLNLPPRKLSPQNNSTDIVLLGFDALDGDSGNKGIAANLPEKVGGMMFTNAFTPLPLTHPAWNSILSGLYPTHHRTRFFFSSPQDPLYPNLYLPWRLKNEVGYQTLFASDQPETSYFNHQQGFEDSLFPMKGWRAHLNAMILNHFIFPAIWLNNSHIDQLLSRTINTPSIFNFDLNRFFNFSFEQLANLPDGPKLMAFHTCYLHTPIRLTFWETSEIPNYLTLSPRMFSFAKWPKPGRHKIQTPKNWVNPYFVRREKLINFLPQLIAELERKKYLQNDLILFLSDHGERFLEGYEIYGGIHGVDLKTRAQNNVVLTLFDPKEQTLKKIDHHVSLVDVTPTLLKRIGLDTKDLPYDGVALLDPQGNFQPPPQRPIIVESMGWIEDETEKNKFPQISIRSLEESLIYSHDGTVTIGPDYYERVLLNKEFTDLTQIPPMTMGKENHVP